MAGSPSDHWSEEVVHRHARRVLEDRAARVARTHRAGDGGRWAPIETVWVALSGTIGGVAGCREDGEVLAALHKHLEKAAYREHGEGKDDEGRPLPTDADRAMVLAALIAAGIAHEEAGSVVTEAWRRLWDLHEEERLPDAPGLLPALTSCDLDRAARRHRHLLVIGEPGSGKTTLLSHLASEAARGLLDGGTWLGLGERAPLPVVVPLARVAERLPAVGRRAGSAAVVAAVSEQMGDAGEHVGTVAAALHSGALLVLLDALDEVASESERPRVAEAVAAFVAEHPACRVVVTTRPAGLGSREDKALGGLPRAVLHDLGRAQVRRLLGKWLRALLGDEEVAAARLGEALAHLWSSDETAGLARRPITLVMLARVLEESSGALPGRPCELYEMCVRSLAYLLDVEEREEGDGVPIGASHPKLGSLSHDDRLAILEQIAWRIVDEESGAHLSPGRVEEVVRGVLGDRAGGQREVERVVAALASRSGLIRSDGREGWTFVHREIRDYLAARHAVGARVGQAATRVTELLDAPPRQRNSVGPLHDPQERRGSAWWRSVIAFMPGALLARHGDHEAARDVALELAESAAHVTGAEARANAMAAVAAALLDLRVAALAEAPGDRREARVTGLEAVARTLKDPSEKALLLEAQPGYVEGRFLLARVLGFWGDGRLSPEARWVAVPGGPGWQGQAEGDDDTLGWEKPGGYVTVSPFRIQRWCVTVGEYASFIDAGGYSVQQWWHPAGWQWREKESVMAPDNWDGQGRGSLTLPVTGVSWWEADAFCRWVTRTRPAVWQVPPGEEVRLPTEAEWERAARGGNDVDGGDPARVRIYPWGREPGPELALSEKTPGLRRSGWARGGPEPVGCFAGGCGPYGTWDQAGNVWEWCLDAWNEKAYQQQGRPSDPLVIDDDGAAVCRSDGRVCPRIDELPPAGRRVVRGGSFVSRAGWLRASYRYRWGPGNRFGYLGFRCVVSPPGRALAP